MGMTLRENQRDYYYQMLDQYFPGLKTKYIKTYGNKYQCMPPNAMNLYKVFTRECDKYKILYNMKDIITAYKEKSKTNQQMSLFDR